MGKGDQTTRNRIIALILLAAGILFVMQRKSAFSTQLNQAFDGLPARITQKGEYLSIRPKGEVRGGVILYPQDLKNPLEYLPMLRELAEKKLEIRVATYPLGFSGLSGSNYRDILEDGNQLTWVTLGMGGGALKACSLADKSDLVAGLILIGACSGEVNLNDNDLQVTLFELDSAPMDEALMAEVQKKLPADTLYLRASAEAEVIGALSAQRSGDLTGLPQKLTHEIDRMLSARLVSPKNRK